MKLNPKLKSYATILVFLIIGMLLMSISQLFETPEWFNPTFLVLGLFVVMNIATAKILKLKTELQSFWSIRKIYFLPIGIAAGAMIAISPLLAGLLTGATSISHLKPATDFTLTAVVVTLAIVAWEELWFRGVFLNYCNRNLSAVSISIAIGLLFMLIHLMNPEIDLLKTGPTLFFAGALLTIVYFYYRTIWLPIGIHFGNNYLTIQSNLDKHWLYGNEGYFGAIILAILYLLFVKFAITKTNTIKMKHTQLNKQTT